MSKDRALSQLREMQDRVGNLINAVSELPELPRDVHLWSTDTELGVHIPYDWQTFRKLRQCLSRQWKYVNQFQASDGDLLRTYSNGKVELTVTLLLGRKGATCHREIIGKEEVPIYKVVCN